MFVAWSNELVVLASSAYVKRLWVRVAMRAEERVPPPLRRGAFSCEAS